MGQQVITYTQIPTKGLYTSSVADAIGPEYAPWCQNVRFRFGQIIKCPGRSATQQTLSSALMDFALHTDAAGTKTVFGITSSGGPGAYTTSAATYDKTANQFATPFTLGLTSQQEARASWTCGEEKLMIVRASTIAAVSNSGGPWAVEQVSSPAGLFLEYFKNHVFLSNIIGAANRVQWSARGQYNDWATTQTHGGFLDLYDGTVEAITGAKILGDRLVVYRMSSITDMVASGDDESPFLPEGRIYGIGCLCPWSLVNLGQYHMFLGNDYNVYAWDGINLNPVGTPVHSYIRQLYDPGNTQWYTAPFAAAFMGYKEYWLAIYVNNQTFILIYDYLRDTWTRDFIPGVGLTALYEQLLTGTGGPGYSQIGYPSLYPCLMAARGTTYYVIDERIDGDRLNRSTDGGTDMFVDTPDMYYDAKSHLQNSTLERVMVSEGMPRSSGEPAFQLQVSIDRGNNFATSQNIQPTDVHWGFEFSDLNITSNVRRYRFNYPKERGAGAPSLRGYTDVHIPSGEFFPVNRPIGTQLSNVPPTGVDTRQVRIPVGEDEVVSPAVRRPDSEDIRGIPGRDDEPG